MAIKKKNNSRKALAVALGIMGVAGLSLASASQLNITATENLATGVATFGTACDNTVTVAYTTGVAANGTATYTGYTVSGIADACMVSTAKKLTATLNYSTYASNTYSPATALTAADQTIVTGTTNDNKVTVTFATALAGSSQLDSIAITIK